MLAQSLGEYSGQGAVSSGFQRLSDAIVYSVSSATPGTWLTIGVMAVVAWVIWSRLKR